MLSPLLGGDKLFISAHTLLSDFSAECRAFARFDGIDSRRRRKEYVIEDFRSPDLEKLIWEYEMALAGVQPVHAERSMHTLRTQPSYLTTVRSRTREDHSQIPFPSRGGVEEPSAKELDALLPENLEELTEKAKCFPTIKSRYQVLKKRRRNWLSLR
jgi:hypothetical protein